VCRAGVMLPREIPVRVANSTETLNALFSFKRSVDDAVPLDKVVSCQTTGHFMPSSTIP
jgi:hypothetical protein